MNIIHRNEVNQDVAACTVRVVNASIRVKPTAVLNPLLTSVILSILLWLTPDDFTRQWETWSIKGLVLFGIVKPLLRISRQVSWGGRVIVILSMQMNYGRNNKFYGYVYILEPVKPAPGSYSSLSLSIAKQASYIK